MGHVVVWEAGHHARFSNSDPLLKWLAGGTRSTAKQGVAQWQCSPFDAIFLYFLLFLKGQVLFYF